MKAEPYTLEEVADLLVPLHTGQLTVRWKGGECATILAPTDLGARLHATIVALADARRELNDVHMRLSGVTGESSTGNNWRRLLDILLSRSLEALEQARSERDRALAQQAGVSPDDAATPKFADRLAGYVPVQFEIHPMQEGQPVAVDLRKAATLRIGEKVLAVGGQFWLMTFVGAWESYRVLCCLRDLLADLAKVYDTRERLRALELIRELWSAFPDVEAAIVAVEAGMAKERGVTH